MHDVISDIKTIFKEMNTVSKYAIKYGTVIIFTIIIMVIYYYVKAVSGDNSIAYTMIYNDLLYSIKEYIGSVYILPMIAEIIIMAKKI